MKYYTLEAVEKLQERYYNQGGEVVTIKEGVLLDDYLMYGRGLKTTVVKAIYLNSQSSTYTSRSYNTTPAKYLQFIT